MDLPLFTRVPQGHHRLPRRPVEGAKKDGVKGFVKGIGTGFVSGMVKGVSGIKDTWSHAAASDAMRSASWLFSFTADS